MFLPLFDLEAGILRHIYGAVPDLGHDAFQPVTETWAAHAFAIGDAELGAVRRTDDKAGVVREEAVGQPIERCADMGAGVHIDVDRIALSDGEQAGEAAGRRSEAFGAAVGDLVDAAECALSPPPNPLPRGEGKDAWDDRQRHLRGDA